MNWRGISGIYLGLAIGLAGSWLWVVKSATWALGLIGVGLAVAVASTVYLVRSRSGPRPAKVPKAAKAAAKNTAAVADDDADSVARSRLAALAGRTSARELSDEPVDASPAIDADISDELMEDVVETAPEVAPVDFPETVEKEISEAGLPEPFEEALPVPVLDAAPVQDIDMRDDLVVDAALDLERADDRPAWPPLPREIEHVADAEPEPESESIAVQDPVAIAETTQPTGAFDRQPGFPWTARYIALWAQEVRENCPEAFRDAVAHWQRWAVQQDAATPLVEEAAEEFRAMMDVWREELGEVPDLARDDWPARQLYREAEDDAALAALLPCESPMAVGAP